MPSIAWEHFGSDYVMFLKTENHHLYIWFGRSSSSIERRDALEMALKFQTNPNLITLVDDGYEQSMPAECKKIWNSFLPLTKRVVSQNTPLPEQNHTNKFKIYKCGYKGARLHLDQLDVVIPSRDDLSDSQTVYVMDGIAQGIWLWVGALADLKDKISAMGNGRAFMKKVSKP